MLDHEIASLSILVLLICDAYKVIDSMKWYFILVFSYFNKEEKRHREVLFIFNAILDVNAPRILHLKCF